MVDMRTRRVESVEALIRWEHPELGPIRPDDFIGLAEQTELIGPLTEAVLRTAATELMTLGDSEIALSVDVSARSLQDRHFADSVSAVLRETGLPAARLEVEVTERSDRHRGRAQFVHARVAGERRAGGDRRLRHRLLVVRHASRPAADRLKIDRTFIS